MMFSTWSEKLLSSLYTGGPGLTDLVDRYRELYLMSPLKEKFYSFSTISSLKISVSPADPDCFMF